MDEKKDVSVGQNWPERLGRITFANPSDYLNCLMPLLNALHWDNRTSYLFEAFPYYSTALDRYEFLQIIKLLNFNNEHFPVVLKNLEERLLPVLFVRNDHKVFVILEKNNDDITLFYGEENCEKKLKINELDDALWTGTAYTFYPEKLIDAAEAPQHESWFRRLIEKFRLLAWQVVLINFFLNLMSFATPIFIMVVYDKVIAANSISTLINICLGLPIIIVGATFLQILQNKTLAYFGAKLDIEANDEIMQQIYSLPLSYLENAPINSQLSKIKSFDSIRDFFTGPTLGLLLDFLFSFVFIFAIWLIAGKLVWVPIVTMIVGYISSVSFWSYFQKLMKKTNQLSLEQQNLSLEMLINNLAIKYVNSEKNWLKRFETKSAELSFALYKVNVANSMIFSFFDAMITVSAIATLGFGVLMILSNHLTVGALIATMIILWRIFTPIKTIFTILSKFDQVKQNITQVNALMQIDTERHYDKHTDKINFRGLVNFYNVSFRYSPKDNPVLLGVSFKADHNSIIALAGTYASGRSTIVKLLLGLIQPQMGYIQMDNYDLRQLNLHELRHQIAYAPSEISFFNGTIEQNLLLAKPEATLAQINQALKLACVYDDIIELPRGLSTVLKRHDRPTVKVEIQEKLVLARAFIKDAPLILIDTTLDVIDQQSKQTIMNYLTSVKASKTIIIITNDIEVLNNVDRIIFLDRGRVIRDAEKDVVLSDKRLQPFFRMENEKITSI